MKAAEDSRQSMLMKRGQSGSISVKEKRHRPSGTGPDAAAFVEAAFGGAATTAALSSGSSSSSARLSSRFHFDGGSCCCSSPSAFFVSAFCPVAVLLLDVRTNSWPCFIFVCVGLMNSAAHTQGHALVHII